MLIAEGLKCLDRILCGGAQAGGTGNWRCGGGCAKLLDSPLHVKHELRRALLADSADFRKKREIFGGYCLAKRRNRHCGEGCKSQARAKPLHGIDNRLEKTLLLAAGKSIESHGILTDDQCRV